MVKIPLLITGWRQQAITGPSLAGRTEIDRELHTRNVQHRNEEKAERGRKKQNVQIKGSNEREGDRIRLSTVSAVHHRTHPGGDS